MKQKTKSDSLISIILPLVVLATFIALAMGGVVKEYFSNRQPTTTETPAETTANGQKVIQPNAFFYSKVYLKRDKTFVSIPYRFENNQPQTMMLFLTPAENQRVISRLISHPAIVNLDWNVISSDNLRLYQKKKQYQSIETFLQKPPEAEVVYIDPTVKVLDPTKAENIKVLPETAQQIPEDAAYVLTSYIPPRQENGWYYFEDIIDATTALVNSKEELVWQIQAPNATEENPFYLGNVHVDYRQQ